MNQLKRIVLTLQTLTIFQKLHQNPVICRMEQLLQTDSADESAFLSAYAAFTAALFPNTINWSDYLLQVILEQETFYLHRHAAKQKPEPELERCLNEELQILERFSRLEPEAVRAVSSYTGYLPRWETKTHDFVSVYRERLSHIHQYGYGIFAQHHAFFLQNRQLVPVLHPDPQRLTDLTGYGYQRNLIVQNTLALIEGKPASNVLLYGDAGTGKSSTVKAVVNEYADRGLRLIELKKQQLHEIPELIELVGQNPLKFILFIDDLSFAQSDDDFTALKAILEGSISARPDNLAIYATSNRRHLVKETFSEREGDEIHRNDTIQELISLSDRFGLSVPFIQPDKRVYLDIIDGLAARYGVSMSSEILHQQAEAHAISRGGRSPRTAVQFIRSLAAGKDSPSAEEG